MELYTGQMRNYSFQTEIVTEKKKKKTIKKKHSKSILTFDIEVTSAWLQDGKVIGYHKGEDADYWNDLQPLSLPYIWQFSCDDVVYYGREFWDFEKVLKDLPKDIEFIIWVHNLSYEFMFLCNFLTWKDVFARSPRKPIKATSNEYPNIEFRCTYMLTRLSLEAWGEQLGVLKAVGDLDYEVLRTPLTELTSEELYYCEQDCRIVTAGIRQYVERYGRQKDIPITQTGTVRREVKNRLLKDPYYASKIKQLVPRTAEEYKTLQAVFAGGYTHANNWYAGRVIRGYIEHYDFASSYPTVMLCEKYPSAPWIYTGEHELPSIETFDDYAYIFYLRFHKLECTTMNTYIQGSKAVCRNGKYDNGRVMKADVLEMYMTEQDYITISNTYKWDDVEVLRVYKSKKKYLPKPLLEYILELYANKTELKGVEGKEDLYLQSKQYINSLFGMSVTAIVQANVILENDVWKIESLTRDVVEEKLVKLRNRNPKEKRYFMSYSWGCWVTAYARRNLWKCIESCDEEMLYCDTDSIFVLGKHDFSWYNEEITNKIKKSCEINELDFSRTRPKTPKGIEKQLGIFDSEDSCNEFITLGAKRYVERRDSDNKLHLTVSGINKGAVELLEDNIENFKDGFDFDKDAECVTKRLPTYIIEMPTVKWDDGYISKYSYGINLRRNGYLLTMTDEYKELIQYATMDTSELPEQFIVSLRGRFV